MKVGETPENGWAVDHGPFKGKPSVAIARFREGHRGFIEWLSPEEAYDFARRIMSAADRARKPSAEKAA